jgi:Putative beta-barrel porin 2
MRLFPFILLAPAPLLAQVVTPGLVDRTQRPDAGPPLSMPESRQSQALDSETETAVQSPGDQDLGMQLLLKRQERARLFWVMANAGIFATDNAARLPTNEQDDVYFSALLGAGFQPSLGNNWFLDIGITQEIYRYDEFSLLDFESTDATAGVIKLLPEFHNLMLGARYGYRRLTDGDFGDETYSRHAVALTAQKVFLIDRKNSWYLATTVDFDVQTDPEILERFEYSAQAGYDFKLTRQVKLSAFYRFGFRDYQNADIDEANHILGLAATWNITEFARLEASATWTDNDSENDGLDYTAGTGGLAANLRVNF